MHHWHVNTIHHTADRNNMNCYVLCLVSLHFINSSMHVHAHISTCTDYMEYDFPVLLAGKLINEFLCVVELRRE